MTDPDFQKNFCLQIIAQFVSKIEVFGHYLETASLDFAKNFRNGRTHDSGFPLERFSIFLFFYFLLYFFFTEADTNGHLNGISSGSRKENALHVILIYVIFIFFFVVYRMGEVN